MRAFMVTLAVAGILAAACGGAGAPAAGAGAGRVIRIEMSDLAFSPAMITLKPGERVTLSFKNVGAVEHEFMAGQDAMVGKGYLRDWLALAKTEPTVSHGSAGHLGEGVRVLPRGAATIELVAPPQVGEFEFGCFVEGHYENGMRGKLTVDAGRAPNAVPTVPSTPMPPTASRPPTTVAPAASPMNEMEMDGH